MPPGRAIYSQRDILLTKFPFSDLEHFKVRPVLVLSNDAYNRRSPDLLICAVTSSLRQHPFAASLGRRDLEEGVLRVESRVRADTITSIEQQIVLKKIGRVTKRKYGQIVALIQRLIFP